MRFKCTFAVDRQAAFLITLRLTGGTGNADSSSEKARFGTESKCEGGILSDPVERKCCSAGQLVAVETATMVTGDEMQVRCGVETKNGGRVSFTM